MEQLIKRHDFSNFKRVKLSIHSIATRQCQLILGDLGKNFSKPENLIADLTVETPEGSITALLVEIDQPVTERYPYNEDKITSICKITDQKIKINGDSGYTAIEVAVAMNKQLHNHLLPPKDQKWFFTRIDLAHPLQPEHSKNLAITFKHNFNNRLTKSEITSQDQLIGYIFFSLVSQ